MSKPTSPPLTVSPTSSFKRERGLRGTSTQGRQGFLHSSVWVADKMLQD